MLEPNKKLDDIHITMVDGKEYRINGIGTVCLYILLPIILCNAFDFTFWQAIGIVLVIALLRKK